MWKIYFLATDCTKKSLSRSLIIKNNKNLFWNLVKELDSGSLRLNLNSLQNNNRWSLNFNYPRLISQYKNNTPLRLTACTLNIFPIFQIQFQSSLMYELHTLINLVIIIATGDLTLIQICRPSTLGSCSNKLSLMVNHLWNWSILSGAGIVSWV